MTSLRTPHLSTLLLAAVSAALGGCGGRTDVPLELSEGDEADAAINGPDSDHSRGVAPADWAAPTDDVPSNRPAQPEPIDILPPDVEPEERPEPPEERTPPDENGCVSSGEQASVVAGLNPSTPASFVGRLELFSEEAGDIVVRGTEVGDSSGVLCDGARDEETCLKDAASLVANHSPGTLEYQPAFLVTDESGARILDRWDTITEFLGTIDTFNEVAVLLALQDSRASCDDIEADGDLFHAEFIQKDLCGQDAFRMRATINSEGQFTSYEQLEQLIEAPCFGGGRLTDGQCVATGAKSEKPLGTYWQKMCEMETAAVGAFLRLAAELRTHGAPHELVSGALRASQQEVEHAQATFLQARRFGATPSPISQPASKTRSLLELARENAIEGCTRELFGAAVAHLQAAQARDAQMRDTWQKIAREETEHAEWSLKLHAWLKTQLSIEEWETVEEARAAAAQDLASDSVPTPSSELRELAGVPDQQTLSALLDEMRPLLS